MQTLAFYLEQYNKDELMDFARQIGVGKISKLKKAELAIKIALFMLHPEIMKLRLSFLTDQQIDLFEKALEGPIEVAPSRLDDAYRINEMDYGFYTTSNRLVIPEDVKLAYKAMDLSEFHQYRKRMVWLDHCLTILRDFWGVAPVEVLYSLYQNRPKYKIGQQAMMDLFYQIPRDLNDYFFQEGTIYHYGYANERRLWQLVELQRDKPYYIPTYREVMDYYKHFYLSEDSSYQALNSIFIKRFYLSHEDAEDCCYEVWDKVNQNEGLGDIIDFLVEYRALVIESEADLQLLIPALQNAHNHTCLLENRGFRPSELARKDRAIVNGKLPTIVPGSSHAAKLLEQALPEMKAMGFNLDLNANATTVPVIHYPEGIQKPGVNTTKKIYPNDPCPCGSGKKFKKCCG